MFINPGVLMHPIHILLLCLALFSCGNTQTEKQAAPQISTAQIEQGQALYKRYGCAVCHGATGRGDGQMARTLNPRPRDFHDPSAYKYGRSLEAISRIIAKGALNERGMGMPGYPQIPEAELRAIAGYIVSLQTQP